MTSKNIKWQFNQNGQDSRIPLTPSRRSKLFIGRLSFICKLLNVFLPVIQTNMAVNMASWRLTWAMSYEAEYRAGLGPLVDVISLCLSPSFLSLSNVKQRPYTPNKNNTGHQTLIIVYDFWNSFTTDIFLFQKATAEFENKCLKIAALILNHDDLNFKACHHFVEEVTTALKLVHTLEGGLEPSNRQMEICQQSPTVKRPSPCIKLHQSIHHKNPLSPLLIII